VIKKKNIKIIKNSKGNIIKFADLNNMPFKKLGEIYFSEIKPNSFKGWKYHNLRNQYLTVVNGSVEFSFKKNPKDKIKKIIINIKNKQHALYIPKKTHYSFKCLSKNKAVIVNIIDEVVK
tara:strand:- start:6970 stop:7329 length:360 start_codon:yes stop_codon:yes gene_type:complete